MHTYQTKQKTLLLKILKDNSKRSLSSKEIIELLAEEQIMISKATIYRNLDKLFCENLIKRYYDSKTNSYEYQYADAREDCCDHLHLKCTCCGELIHLDCEESTCFIKHLKQGHGFLINEKETVVYGICKNCAIGG